MRSADLRQAFLDFFASKGHATVASSSLVPENDPTLLFTNAGMNQFKDVFLGADKRSYTRATSSQRCVRAGGKHNDLENVGYTARHHTFFEMLGNFSFGDYFKQDAIAFAWEFLTETVKLPKERLLVTVYATDDEAYDLWAKQIGVPEDRIIRIGDKSPDKPFESDNFWQMGDTGPCGPCTEIFYDHGEHIWGGPPGSPEEDGDRFIEIWNLVFMQFNRQSNGDMQPLPKPSVDTGMGLERIAAILQGVHSNYEIDIFQHLIQSTAKRIGVADLAHKSLRVIADHIRSCSFLVVDGVIPSNEGRGYVLRRIIRRAVRHGHKLGEKGLFFAELVPALIEQMGAAFPELKAAQNQVQKVLRAEEEQFAKTLDKGMKILEDQLANLAGKELPGELVFKLHDTYGFPLDLTNDIARERELTIDLAGYETLMAAQRASAGGDQFQIDYNSALDLDGETTFKGYDALSAASKVVALLSDGQLVDSAVVGDEVSIVLDITPFYANSGGQVGDTGFLSTSDMRFEVHDCRKSGQHFVHIGVLQSGALSVGDSLGAEVDASVRGATALNHSATHLVHAALRALLGDHVSQKGSLCDSQRLRFDFAHFEAMTPEQILEVEQSVNAHIRANTPVRTDICSIEEAKEKGAMALFGEKYGDDVRVLTMGQGDFSMELCGGTHAERTGDIGFFKITAESGISAGVRRIEAVTGEVAQSLIQEDSAKLNKIAGLLKSSQDQIEEKLLALLAQNKELGKELQGANAKLASVAASDWASEAVDVKGIKVLAKRVEGLDADAQMDAVDQLKNKLGSAVILLVATNGDKASIVVGVTKAESKRLKAGDLMKDFAKKVDGKGGGRPDMARGACSSSADITGALSGVAAWVESSI